MNYQILALDLDGTLTNSKKEVSRPTLEALIHIQEQGKKVVLASGRPTQGVLPLAGQLSLDRYGSYILSFNGGRITDCRSREVIYNKTLPMDIVAPLFDIVTSSGIVELISSAIPLMCCCRVAARTSTASWNPVSTICLSYLWMISRPILPLLRTSSLLQESLT